MVVDLLMLPFNFSLIMAANTPPAKRRRVARRIDKSLAESIELVHAFFEKEKMLGKSIKKYNVNERVAECMQLSVATVKRVRQRGADEFPCGTEARNRARTVTREDFLNIKKVYLDYITERKRKPTYRALYSVLSEGGLFPYSMKTLFYFMQDNGFRHGPSKSYSQATHERREIVLQRYTFLQRIQQARDEGRVIYYQDESWVNANMRFTTEMVNEDLDEDVVGAIPPPKSGKGARSILCGIGSAGDTNGFLKDSFLLYRGSKSNKSDDYHTEMNSDVFIDWMSTKVLPHLPKLPAKVSIVIDRAPYHMTCTPETAPPPSSATKEDLVRYCETKGVLIPAPHWEGQGRPPIVEYRIARKKSVAEAQGVTKQHLWKCIKDSDFKKVLKLSAAIKKVTRADIQLILLPVHHPELNPIELLWAQVKHHVRANNVEQTQTRAESLVREKVAMRRQEA